MFFSRQIATFTFEGYFITLGGTTVGVISDTGSFSAGGAFIKEMKGQCVMSSHNVICLENVDVFSLEADDLESITKNFYKHMSKPRVQGVLRFLFCSD
jgi:hypothetical protein